MSETTSSEQTNLYVPNLNKKNTSRNNHSRERGKNFGLNKNKQTIISKYSENKIFLFNILQNGFKPVDTITKKELNGFIEEYENYITSINECTNEKRLKELTTMLELLISKINKYINENNFIEFVKKNIFVDSEGTNVKNIEPYSIQIEQQRKEVERRLQQSSIKPGISFADIVRNKS